MDKNFENRHTIKIFCVSLHPHDWAALYVTDRSEAMRLKKKVYNNGHHNNNFVSFYQSFSIRREIFHLGIDIHYFGRNNNTCYKGTKV